MLDAETLAKARQRAVIEMGERHKAFDHEVGRILCGLKPGMLNSGTAGNMVATAVSREYQMRADILWELLARVLDPAALTKDPDPATKLKDLLKEWLDHASEDLAAPGKRLPEPARSVLARWCPDQGRAAALTKVNSDIDLFVLTARRAPRDQGGAGTTNIQQTYGIIQTGQGATATLHIDLSPSVRDALSQALDAVDHALSQQCGLPDVQLQTIRELVTHVRTEAAKPSPDGPRLRQWLSDLGATIQTMGSATAAYQLLKVAATAVGVPLP